MNVLVLNEYRIGLTLSHKELDYYGITYEELDYSNIETRKFLWKITEDIRKNCGYNISLSGKMLIEVMRDREEAIKIYLTFLSRKSSDDYSLKQLIKNDIKPVTAEFFCFEDMLEAAVCLKGDIKSSLFERNGKYRLVLMPEEKDRESVIFSLCEFSQLLSDCPVEKASSEEHWTLIASSLALSQLTRAFSAE